MLFKLSNLNSNFALTLGYLNPALNNSTQNSGLWNQDMAKKKRNHTNYCNLESNFH